MGQVHLILNSSPAAQRWESCCVQPRAPVHVKQDAAFQFPGNLAHRQIALKLYGWLLFLLSASILPPAVTFSISPLFLFSFQNFLQYATYIYALRKKFLRLILCLTR
jgi:hypothetical protein